MFINLIKGREEELTKNLMHSEFWCRCKSENCLTTIVNVKLLKCFNELREAWGEPIFVNSGYRCAKHNESVGGAKHSYHRTGSAIDLRKPKSQDKKDEFVSMCAQVFPYIIEYSSFVHCDVRG